MLSDSLVLGPAELPAPEQAHVDNAMPCRPTLMQALGGNLGRALKDFLILLTKLLILLINFGYIFYFGPPGTHILLFLLNFQYFSLDLQIFRCFLVF